MNPISIFVIFVTALSIQGQPSKKENADDEKVFDVDQTVSVTPPALHMRAGRCKTAD